VERVVEESRQQSEYREIWDTQPPIGGGDSTIFFELGRVS